MWLLTAGATSKLLLNGVESRAKAAISARYVQLLTPPPAALPPAYLTAEQKVLLSWLMADVSSDTGANTTRMAKGVVMNCLSRLWAWLNHSDSQFTSSGPGAGCTWWESPGWWWWWGGG